MTCKDCIHNELCEVMHKFGVVDLPYNDETICELFKNKADVIVPPCKVGETLYLIQIDYIGNYSMSPIIVSSKITMFSILRAYEEKTVIYMSTDKNKTEQKLQALKGGARE